MSRRLPAQVSRIGIGFLIAGLVVWAHPVAAQHGGVADPCRNGIVVPEPQGHAGLVADCEVLWGLRDQLDLSRLNWKADTPISQWQGITVRDSRVTRLNLNSNYLEVLPPEIGQLTQLESLNLNSNYLEVLPPEIGQLTQLESLNLNYNYLEVLPPEIGQLSKLEHLAIFANDLRTIPPEIGQLTQLDSLDLGANDLEVLPPEIGQLSKLEHLVLSANDFKTIPIELSQLGNLRRLSISSCWMRGPILPELGNLGQLERLALSGNGLSGAIPPELGQLASLQVLNLYGNDLTGKIPPELGQLASLQVLNLYGNDLTGKIPPELGQLVSLQVLNLYGNDLTGEIPPELGQLVSLQVLDLSENDLTGQIPPDLGRRTALLELDLSHNRLSGPLPTGLSEIVLRDPSGWGEVDLSHNRLSGPLPPKLSEILLQNQGIYGVFVDFRGNEMICVPDWPLFAFVGAPACGAPQPEPSKGRIYWTDLGSGDIQRADLDGSNFEIVIDGGGSPERIALDIAGGKIYWTKWNGAVGKIQRSDLDGSNSETIVVTGPEHPRGIALDLDADKVYYTVSSRHLDIEYGVVVDVYFSGGVRRANLDGSSPEDLVWDEWLGGLEVGIALNVSAGTMFWTDGGAIRRANLDGTGDTCSPCLPIATVDDLNTVDIVLDEPGGRIYWSDSQGIHRADLDGSNKETLVPFDGQPVPRGLAVDLEGGRMYWTDSQAVYRADLDGSNAEPLPTGVEHPGGIAFDPVGHKMYWTEPGKERIRRVDLDGTSVETLIAEVRRAPVGLALDMVETRMYWTDRATNRIHRADLDGTNVEDLAGGLTAPGEIALDVPGGKMYWTNRDASVIHRADLDGGNVESIVIPGDPDGIVGLALDLAAGRMYWMDWRWDEDRWEDSERDMTHRIGRARLPGTRVEILLRRSFYSDGFLLRPGVGGLALDPVGDRIYSVLWYPYSPDNHTSPVLLGSLRRSNLAVRDIESLGIPTGRSGAIAVDGVGRRLYWSEEDWQSRQSTIHWSDLQGHEAPLITGLSRVGSIALEVSRPEITVWTFLTESGLPALSGLAPNYPNPFNVGTRLVYRLADPGPVRLEIFNVLGQRVRTLVDETQEAGSYQIPWDTLDQGGTPAATGVYVTRLQYPGGEQTRRLLLLK